MHFPIFPTALLVGTMVARALAQCNGCGAGIPCYVGEYYLVCPFDADCFCGTDDSVTSGCGLLSDGYCVTLG